MDTTTEWAPSPVPSDTDEPTPPLVVTAERDDEVGVIEPADDADAGADDDSE